MQIFKDILERYFPTLKKSISNIHLSYRYYLRKNMSEEQWIINTKETYERLFGKELDLEDPKTYTEKMQFSKLFLNSPIKTELTDKLKVREWIKDKIGEQYLIPLLGVWDKVEDIDYEQLPEQFVLKTNHGTRTNIVVKNKSQLNVKKTNKKLDKWMKTDYTYTSGFQPHYKDIERKIFAEKYMENTDGTSINDYKFLCFNGDVYYFWIDFDRSDNHKRNVYNLNWELQDWNQHDYGNYQGNVVKPKKFNEMVEIARILCNGFSHVRVDLYYIDDQIYFGEMTFTNGSGFEKITPSEADLMLGELWHLE